LPLLYLAVPVAPFRMASWLRPSSSVWLLLPGDGLVRFKTLVTVSVDEQEWSFSAVGVFVHAPLRVDHLSPSTIGEDGGVDVAVLGGPFRDLAPVACCFTRMVGARFVASVQASQQTHTRVLCRAPAASPGPVSVNIVYGTADVAVCAATAMAAAVRRTSGTPAHLTPLLHYHATVRLMSAQPHQLTAEGGVQQVVLRGGPFPSGTVSCQMAMGSRLPTNDTVPRTLVALGIALNNSVALCSVPRLPDHVHAVHVSVQSTPGDAPSTVLAIPVAGAPQALQIHLHEDAPFELEAYSLSVVFEAPVPMNMDSVCIRLEGVDGWAQCAPLAVTAAPERAQAIVRLHDFTASCAVGGACIPVFRVWAGWHEQAMQPTRHYVHHPAAIHVLGPSTAHVWDANAQQVRVRMAGVLPAIDAVACRINERLFEVQARCSPTACECTLPALPPGAYTLRMLANGVSVRTKAMQRVGPAQSYIRLSVSPRPTLTRVVPTVLVWGRHANLTVQGTNFDQLDSVECVVQGVAVDAVVHSDTELLCLLQLVWQSVPETAAPLRVTLRHAASGGDDAVDQLDELAGAAAPPTHPVVQPRCSPEHTGWRHVFTNESALLSFGLPSVPQVAPSRVWCVMEAVHNPLLKVVSDAHHIHDTTIACNVTIPSSDDWSVQLRAVFGLGEHPVVLSSRPALVAAWPRPLLSDSVLLHTTNTSDCADLQVDGSLSALVTQRVDGGSFLEQLCEIRERGSALPGRLHVVTRTSATQAACSVREANNVQRDMQV
ncbi:MAG: hypothetical protein EOO65_02550, partial [Methanosarcinales archaeon]